MRTARRWIIASTASLALVLAACGGDDAPDPVEEPGAAADDVDLGDMDLEDLDEMREQLEALGQAAEEFELEPVEQDPDRPLLLPADVTITGDLQGTYTDNPGCGISDYVDADDTYHQDALTIRFGWAGHTVDWTSDLPDDPRPLSVVLGVPGFTGGGTYQGSVGFQGVEHWADGTVEVTIVENRREEFPTGEVVVIEGTFSGTYAGAAGSGDISGDIGVCNVRAP